MLIRLLALVPAAALRRLQRLVPAEVAIVTGAPRASAEQVLATGDHDLVVVDRRRAGRHPARLVERLRALPRPPEVIVLCDNPDPVDRASLFAAGFMAVVDHNLDDATLADTLHALLVRVREGVMQRMRAQPDDARGGLEQFASESPVMHRFLAVARKLADRDVSLLILGETGVGKERLARAMHDEGPRRDSSFVAVNCGALPEPLLESELFGHEAGAFTGAAGARRGFFELAHGGTLFLDEIAEIELSLQVKLLRAVQERRVRRLGGEREIGVDVRLIAATNRDLPAEVAAGRFRADLYYRIAVVTLTLPPLRERREDIRPLIAAHVEALSTRLGKRAPSVAEDAFAAMLDYPWPGNVRELVNVLERAVLLCDGASITATDLPESIARRGAASAVPGRDAAELMRLPFAQARERLLQGFELEYFTGLLRRNHGRIGETARQAGITPRALYDKMLRLGLRKEQFRGVPAEPVRVTADDAP